MPSILRDQARRLRQRLVDDASTGGLVARQRVNSRRHARTAAQQRGASTGDDALIDGSAGGRDSVLDTVLLLLELHLGGGADLNDSHTPGHLGEALLELLAVPVGVGVIDLRLDLVDAALHVGGAASTLDDGAVVLGDHHLAGRAHQRQVDRVELQPDLFGHDLAAREDRHVLQHCLAALAEPGRLDGNRVESATDLVHHERGKGLTLHVLGDDQHGFAGLHHLLEHRQQVLDVADLALVEQHIRLVEHGLLPLRVGDEVRGEIALVELHALDEVEVHPESVALLYGDDAVFADLVEGFRQRLADRSLGR